MKIFDYMEKYAYEHLVFFHDAATGLKGITCIHSTKLGPALGGTRLLNYKNEDDAIEDVLRLAKGMTLKSAAAGLDYGGGKTVLIGDPKKVKCEAYFRALGRFIETLNGRYITAEDMNTSTEDMAYVAKETSYVKGLRDKSGNPSPMTAYGVYHAMRASAFKAYGSDDIKGKRISIQGIGQVGIPLADILHKAGAKLIVTDNKQSRMDEMVEKYGATAVGIDEIYDQDVDIFSPCARGAVINDTTINRLKCKIIAGAANNVLGEEIHAEVLKEKGILYAPDYVANAGGVINVTHEHEDGYNKEMSVKAIEGIYNRLLTIFEISDKENISTDKAALKMAYDRIETLTKVHSIYVKPDFL